MMAPHSKNSRDMTNKEDEWRISCENWLFTKSALLLLRVHYYQIKKILGFLFGTDNLNTHTAEI